ncbi:MAG TPA: phosphotransferase family protein [Novosphingobium sp.]
MRPETSTAPELAARLRPWLEQVGLPAAALTRLARAAGGRSSETWLVDARAPDGALHAWVLRIQPRIDHVYEDPSVARQFHMIRALSGRTGLPVPAALALEEDPAVLGAPFFLMERAEGTAPPDPYHNEGLLAAASPAEREALWAQAVTLLARLNTLDPAPFAFLAWPAGPADDGVAQELARWDSFRHWAGIPQLSLYDRALRWLDDHRPAPAGIGLAWGDARPTNVLYAAGRITAVLDWETASLGTAETDLGWWLAYDRMMSDAIGVPRLDGLPDAAGTIALWEAASGRKARAMEWHLAFAAYRFAMISERALMLAVRAGTMPASMTGPGNPMVRLLEELVAG